MGRSSQMQWLFAAAAVATFAVNGNAQLPTPIYFLGGYHEPSGNWGNVAVDLGNHYSLSWTFSPQDNELSYASQNSALGTIDPSTIMIGHSGGGIVARLRGRDQVLRGIVTYGSPNGGIPLTNSAGYVADYIYWTLYDYSRAYNAYHLLLEFPDPAVDDEISQRAEIFAPILSSLSTWALTQTGYVGSPAILTDVNPNSTFITSTLNGSAGLYTEGQNVGLEVNVVLTTDDFYYGGMPRSVLGDFDGSLFAAYYYGTAAVLGSLAFDLYLSDDPYGATVADWLLDASDALFYFDEDWCRAVSSSAGPYGSCQPNDELVPISSQRSNAGVEFPVLGAPVHINEIDVGFTSLDTVLGGTSFYALPRH